MEINKSNNGYCNVWVIGQAGVGKTTLIYNLFGKQIYFDGTKNNVEIESLIVDGNYKVKLQIIERRDLKKSELDDYIKFNDNPSVFLILSHLSDLKYNEHNKRIIDNIQKTINNPLIYFFYSRRFINKPTVPKVGRLIRETFNLDNLESFEFVSFYDVLKNSIINISTNRLDYARELIENCFINKIDELDLGKNSLTSLYEIPELFYCTHLKKLVLSNEWAEFTDGKWKKTGSKNFGEYNTLNYIPEEIKKLKNLETLNLGGNWDLGQKHVKKWKINNITILSQLSNLKYLNVSNNNILALPNFCKLPNLEVLHLNNNDIFKSYFEGEFKKLKELYLSNNSINNLTFFNKVKFPSLMTLDIHSNKVRDLEPITDLIRRINISNLKWEKNTINVAKNPLEKPPIEIINISKQAVINYFEELSKGKSYVNKDIKIILVGNSEVGKTTLAKYLDGEKELEKEHSSTHWMEERQITSKHFLDKIKQRCIINLFDFGGHDFFHDTHHLFFSSNTLYILLWDESSNCLQKRRLIQTNSRGLKQEVEFHDFPLKYWLESIRYFITEDNTNVFDFDNDNLSDFNSDVLVVQNKVYQKEDQIFLNNKELKDLYPFIYDFISVSIKEKNKTDYFDEILAEMLNNTSIIGKRLLDYYGKTKDAIKNYEDEPIISIKEFQVFCNSINGVDISIEQTKILANYLNQVGVILYYPNSQNKNLVYINKKWVIDKVYRILEGLYEKNGEFDESYLDLVFNNTLNKKQKNNILNLMIDFKILFKNPYNNNFIAPLYLPEKPIQLMEIFINSDKKPYRKFLYKGFIHKNVILNIFQAYGELVLSEKKGNNNYYYYWKNGLIIKDPETYEIVKIIFNLGDDEGNASIDLYKLTHDNDSGFVFQIINSINEINSKYDVDELITIDGINYLPLKIIHKNEENKNWTFLHNEIYYKLSDFKKFLKNPSVMKKIFISYSKQDLKLIKKFIEHLSSLQLDGKVSYWYCSELEAGSEWNKEIQTNFDEADIICFMISPNFMRTKYIHEHEIARAFERKEIEPNLKIVPIILDFCRWTTTNNNLGKFTCLPFTAKPVVDFDNQNMAWYIIEECLRAMIEKDLNPIGDTFYTEHLAPDILKIYERIIDGSANKN